MSQLWRQSLEAVLKVTEAEASKSPKLYHMLVETNRRLLAQATREQLQNSPGDLLSDSRLDVPPARYWRHELDRMTGETRILPVLSISATVIDKRPDRDDARLRHGFLFGIPQGACPAPQ